MTTIDPNVYEIVSEFPRIRVLLVYDPKDETEPCEYQQLVKISVAGMNAMPNQCRVPMLHIVLIWSTAVALGCYQHDDEGYAIVLPVFAAVSSSAIVPWPVGKKQPFWV